MDLTRRRFLAGSAALAGPLALSACGGFAPAGSSQSQAAGTLSFTTWGTDAELAGFRSVIAAFQSANPGTTVNLNAVPYEQMFSNIDAQIQAGNPPDLFRVPYYTFGSYAGAGQLLDLTPYLGSGFSDRFTSQAWAAVQNTGKPYGVPHHTDTSVILYNSDLLDAAGVTSIPTDVDKAWTWDQLRSAGAKLRASLPGSKYPMAYNWQGNGVTRWLSLLFQSDGRFLAEDLKTPAIDSDAGRAAVDFSKSFFADKLVPPNDSVKSTTYAADTWYSQTVAMVWGGAFMLPAADTTATFSWGATYAPRNVRGGGDFGGNALVATAKAKQPELAAKFLDFATGADQQKAFCVGASLLPTRADLVNDGISFTVRPELTKVFLGQARQVRASDSSQVASPSMSKIITVLKDQLEQAFVGGQSTAATISGLTKGIGSATGAS